MVPNNPFTGKLSRKLAYQLVPAGVVTAVGIVVLSSLARTPAPAPEATPIEPAINGEAVFTATPRPPEPVEANVAPAPGMAVPVPRPKIAVTTPPKRPANETANPRQATGTPPLQIAQAPPLQQVAPPAPAPAPDNSLMGKFWSTTVAVIAIPQRAASSVAGWFAPLPPPPRPPGAVPTQNFQASM